VEPVNSPPKVEPGLIWSGPRRAVSDGDIAEQASHLRLQKSAAVRLHLQRRAPANLRHHVRRAAVRLAVLITADLLTFGVIRELVRAVREGALLGAAVADGVQLGFPVGTLNGWQYAVALLLGLVVMGSYRRGDRRRDPRRLFFACALATALPLWSTLWTRGVEPVLVQYAATVVLVWLALAAERLTIDRVVARIYPQDRNAVDTLFVGPAADCIAAASSAAFATGTDYQPIGFVDVQIPPAPGALGHVSDIPMLLAASGAQVVALCGYLTDHQFQDVVDSALAGGCQVLAVPRAAEIAGVHPTTVWRHGQPLVELTAPSLKAWQLFVKRVLDLIGAAVGLSVALPVMILVALAIKLTSAGPVFFLQERIGNGGRRFRVFKFRTMYDGVSDLAHRELVGKMLRGQEAAAAHVSGDGEPVYKLINDQRITGVGRWLRRASLDELPQLFNVLRGDMSLVGPRPPLPYEFEAYDHWQFDRLQVRPGITGLWQVSGRNRLTYRQMCELDMQYIREWSLWLDVKILLKTPLVVLSNSGRAA
jgi:exopolysaccharide biosynthesis polyprenyl glycosylphosphotransferase